MKVSAELKEHKQYSFETYFKKVLINKARNIYKKRIQQQDQEISFSDLPVETVRLLLPKYREILMLSYFMDCSDVEIAERLKIPVSTVGDRRRKAACHSLRKRAS